MKKQLLTGALAAAAVGVAMMPNPAQALVLTSQLTGDPRLENPDGLIVDVTIETGADAGLADYEALWTINLNSGVSHPDMKLDAFYFNVVGDSDDYSFYNFNPEDWEVTSGNNAAGSGSADFIFEADKSQGNVTDVTNSQPLTFTMKKDSEEAFTLEDFLNASVSTGASELGEFQLGAHLQSLELNSGATSDSGFAVGNYETGETEVIPTPAAVLPGLMGMGAAVFRKKKQEGAVEQEA